MYACLAVTCHLHFWQNDRDFLRATVVTRGWNGYQNKSQHRKSTLEKKILPPFQQGFEPTTFQSRVRCSNHWAIPAPNSSQGFKSTSVATTRTAKQGSAVCTETIWSCCVAAWPDRFCLSFWKPDLYCVQWTLSIQCRQDIKDKIPTGFSEQHSALIRRQKSSDHQGTVPAKQCWVA